MCEQAKMALCMFAGEFPCLYSMGIFFGNTHFCLCLWDTRQYKNVQLSKNTIVTMETDHFQLYADWAMVHQGKHLSLHIILTKSISVEGRGIKSEKKPFTTYL